MMANKTPRRRDFEMRSLFIFMLISFDRHFTLYLYMAMICVVKSFFSSNKSALKRRHFMTLLT